MYRRGHTGGRPKAWYERADGTELLRSERALIQEHYPSLSYRPDPDGGQLHLEGEIVLQSDCGVSTPISVRIDFPTNYPKNEPRAYDTAGRFPPSDDRHIFKDGQFCLWLPPCSRWEGNDPRRLLRFLDEVTVFLDRQLIYDATNGQVWPGPEYGHGPAGYEEFILSEFGDDRQLLHSLHPVLSGRFHPGRNEMCPCGSGKKYKHCHLSLIESIIVRVGHSALDRLYNPLRENGGSQRGFLRFG